MLWNVWQPDSGDLISRVPTEQEDWIRSLIMETKVSRGVLGRKKSLKHIVDSASWISTAKNCLISPGSNTK